MSNKAFFERDVINRVNELDEQEDMLCIGLLSLSSYSSSARATMLTQHLNQALVPDKPEIPAVCTGYEQMFGEFSTTCIRAEHNYEVIKKIEKHPGYVYTLLVYDKKNDMYDIITRHEVNDMAEHYGFTYENSTIDKLKPGDKIKKDTMLSRPPTIDKDGNFMYGVNGKVVYVVSQETIEDAIVVSESFAKKMSTTKVESCYVPCNDNDIPLNLYGDFDSYKSFPDIGEYTQNSILCGLRKRNKMLDQLNMKNSNLTKVFSSDDIFQFIGNYKVVDIDIWCNKSEEYMIDIPAYDQINRYYNNAKRYYKEIFETFGELVKNGDNYSPALSRLYAEARNYLDPSCKYSDDEKIFSNIIIKFTLSKSCPLIRGCKLCGRYGNKSVISKVLPDEEMGITEDGIVPDVRMDALGVLGRLNDGQSIEQELNWIAELVRREMEKAPTYKKKLSLLFRFLKIASPSYCKKMIEYVDSIKEKEGDSGVHEFVDSIIKDRIIIMESPTHSISGDGMYELYKEFQPKMVKMKYTDDNGDVSETLRPMIVADEYILRLKQEPETKFSCRYKSMINPRTFLPIKSTKASKHKTIYSDQSNRVGEQELNVFMLGGDSDALDYFYRSHSSSIDGRRSTTLFEEDSSKGFIINMNNENSCSIDILNAHLKSMGERLNIDCDKLEPEEDQYDLPSGMPDFLNQLYDSKNRS